MTKISKPRVSLENASRSTQHRKSKEMQQLREVSVGKGKDAISKSILNEIRRVDKETQKDIAKAINDEIVLDVETFHDLKVVCGLSYSQIRDM